jgi:hypothetical protein
MSHGPLFTRSSGSLSQFHPSALTRSTARPVATAAPASTAASRPASSAAAGLAGGLLAALCGWLALFVMLVIAPIIMLANGVEPGAALMWMAMVIASLVITWWTERREQRRWLREYGRPKPENYSAGAAFRRRWGLAEESCAHAEKTAPETAWTRLSKWAARWGAPKVEAAPAGPAEPVPAFVVNELPGVDGVYNARVYTVTDAFADTMAEVDRLNLTREERIEALASVLRGAQPYRNSKPADSQAKQPVSRGGAGSQGSGPQLRQGRRGPVIEAKAGRAWLPRR